MIFREDWNYEPRPMSSRDPFVRAAEALCGHAYPQLGMYHWRRWPLDAAKASLTRTLARREECECPRDPSRYGPPCWAWHESNTVEWKCLFSNVGDLFEDEATP